MMLFVGSKNPVKIQAAHNTIRQLDGLAECLVEGVAVPSGVADQPMTEEETRQGAVNRVHALLDSKLATQDDWLVAIEGGVDKFEDGPATFAYVAIYHANNWAVGRSANLPLPEEFYTQLTQGMELGDVMDKAFNTENVKQKGGAIGLLTDNTASRQSVYEVAMTLALARFRFPDLYD
ncbi:non-canonical purine NTP phosphatase [Alteromonas sediminis]|uniref:Inosine/xanthosine triphosphatase n=1 Tax=Alteromonas sediminis TaxID=2259342 RepID=A0A3N5YC00_9ALTE|nr:inosine/xanthosine triphosphatase [Alteromonas sediminis]RPJ66685.1 non-canonical purine NTP phosphatase [Alteromonas sediminis]